MRFWSLFCAVIIALFFESCDRNPNIDISFSLLEPGKSTPEKTVRILVKNNSKKNVFILGTSLVTKIGVPHPCNNDLIGEYSKISSHKKKDCTVNPGVPLFNYIQTVPFNRSDHILLKRTVLNFFGKDSFFSLWFYYLNPTFSPSIFAEPKFIFIDAKQSTYIDFNINGDLKPADRGTYRIGWYSNEKIRKIIFREDGKQSIRSAIEGKLINGYQFYDGDFAVHPIEIKL